MTLGIVAQRGNDRAATLAAEIRESLQAEGVKVLVDRLTAESLGIEGHHVESLDEAILVVSIGGDGTFLFTARSVGDTPIVGINLGEVGFLNAVAPADAVDVARSEYYQAVSGTLKPQVFPRLAARFGERAIGPALNEVVVHAPQRGRGFRIDVTIQVDGSVYTEDRTDGVMVATPTGSTAYNLSEAGPLVQPDLDGFVVNTLCGQRGMPPLVIDADATVELDVAGSGTAFVIADGRTQHPVSRPVSVTVERTGHPVRIAGPQLEFFEALGKLEAEPSW